MKDQHAPFLVPSLAALLCAAASAAAADKADSAPLTGSAFVSKAAQAGMAEVELGKVALDKSKDKDVRQFADRMVKDHSKANDELMDIVKRKNMTVPATLDAKHRAMVDALKGKSGEAFNAAYAEHMAMDHDKALDLFKAASRAKDLDAELSGFARKTLPTLEEHKHLADTLKAHETAESEPAKSRG